MQVALYVFVVGVCCIELYNPAGGFQPWNLLMVALAALSLVVIAVARATARDSVAPRLFFFDFVYLAYLALLWISAYWSVSRTDTLVQAVYATLPWLATVALRTVALSSALRAIVRTGTVIAVLSILAVVALPGIALQPSASWIVPELRGIYQHQQRLGLFLGMILGLIAITAVNGAARSILPRSKLGRNASILSVVVGFVGASARLNSVYVVIAVVVAVGLTKSRGTRLLSLGILVASVIYLVFQADSLVAGFGSSGGDLTLTGRSNVWERTLLAIDQGPATGYGFATFTSEYFDAYWSSYRAPSAHNSLLQALFETGAAGAIAILAVVIVQLFAGIRSSVRTGRVSYSTFLVLLSLFSSVTGVTYAGKPTVLMIVTLLVLGIESQAALADDSQSSQPARGNPRHGQSRVRRSSLIARSSAASRHG